MIPKIRLGLVGAGVWGRNYIKTIEQIEGVVLEKIVCKNPQNKKVLSQKYEVTDDWLGLSKSKIIDGAIIATPPSTHFDIAVEFIKNKKRHFRQRENRFLLQQQKDDMGQRTPTPNYVRQC